MQKTAKNRKLLDNESGFTLVELIVAIAIMVILLGAAITYFPAYRNQQVLRQGSLDVNNSLRQTQTLAFAPDVDDSDYYVWQINEGGADVGCLTEKYISIVSQSEVGEDVTNSNNIICLDDKVLIETDFDALYFQVQTGKIYSDETLTTPAYGQIKVEHTAMQKDSDYYYNIGIYNDSFDLLSSDLGEVRDLPGEPPSSDGDEEGDGGDDTGGSGDEGDTGGQDGGDYSECTEDSDCLPGCSCLTSQSDVNYCYCGDEQTQSVCGNDILETGEQCGDEGVQCAEGYDCESCQCVAVEYCGDGQCNANETNQSCSQDCPLVCGDGYCNEAAGETYISCDADCEAPPPDEQCIPDKSCSSNRDCNGGTCESYWFWKRCNCDNASNPNLKSDRESCDTGSECSGGYCVFNKCSSDDFLCRYFPQFCT